jgi:hypothetical protein
MCLSAALLSAQATPSTAQPESEGRQYCRSISALREPEQAIAMLEKAWLTAEVHGDVAFLDCLLAPEYSVISVKRDQTVSKKELLLRVSKVERNHNAIPTLRTKVAVNGGFAVAYSWIESAPGKATASYVDFYRHAGGRWHAVGGVDL